MIHIPAATTTTTTTNLHPNMLVVGITLVVDDRRIPPRGIETTILVVAFLLPNRVNNQIPIDLPNHHRERGVKKGVLVSDESLLSSKLGAAKPHSQNPKIDEKNAAHLPKRMIVGPRVLYQKTRDNLATKRSQVVVVPTTMTKQPKRHQRDHRKMESRQVVPDNVVVVLEGLMDDLPPTSRKPRQVVVGPRAVIDVVVVVIKPSHNVILPK